MRVWCSECPDSKPYTLNMQLVGDGVILDRVCVRERESARAREGESEREREDLQLVGDSVILDLDPLALGDVVAHR